MLMRPRPRFPEPSPTGAGRNGAMFVTMTRRLPSTLVSGRRYTVALTMRNSGTTIWRADDDHPHRLGAQHPRDTTRWGLARIDVPAEVQPGAEAMFTFAVIAPRSPGRYHFQWRMVQDGVGWFGQASEDVVVTVAPLSSSITYSGDRFSRYREADPREDTILEMRMFLREATWQSF